MPSIEIIDGGIILESLADAWDQLNLQSVNSTPFQSRQWIQLWLEHFGQESRLRTIVIREGNDIVALYPLIRSTSPWKSLRPAGVGPSDYLAPLVLEHRSDVQEVLMSALQDLGRSHMVDLHQIPNDHSFAGKVDQFDSIEQARCLVLDLPGKYEDYVASLSKSLRYDVRRLAGKALTEKNAVVEWADETNSGRFADQFFELHKARWKSRGLPGAFFGKNERFQRSWIDSGVKSGAVVMNQLVCDGKSVGSVYAMRQGTTMYFYQAGMDPQASSLSPGTILVAKMIERAIETGCTSFDFMRGDEPYKRRWKPNRERINLRILLPTQNVVGKAGIWWNSAAWRVELKVRTRLEGKSLRPSKGPK